MYLHLRGDGGRTLDYKLTEELRIGNPGACEEKSRRFTMCRAGGRLKKIVFIPKNMT